MTAKTLSPIFYENETPVSVSGSTELWVHLVEIVKSIDGEEMQMIDLWGMCDTCEQVVRVENHTHTHACELTDQEGCSWIDPDEIGDEIGNDLIPPETVGDWDASLYLVGPTGSNYGTRTRRVNGVIVESDVVEVLPEVGHDLEELDKPFQCSYCKRRFASSFYYAFAHTCSGWQEAKALLAQSKLAPVPEVPVGTAVRREAASRDNWYEADRNRVPSELGKLDWLNPRQD